VSRKEKIAGRACLPAGRDLSSVLLGQELRDMAFSFRSLNPLGRVCRSLFLAGSAEKAFQILSDLMVGRKRK
jgi:hypothetical protein